MIVKPWAVPVSDTEPMLTVALSGPPKVSSGFEVPTASVFSVTFVAVSDTKVPSLIVS